jgi:hypothetical protein
MKWVVMVTVDDTMIMGMRHQLLMLMLMEDDMIHMDIIKIFSIEFFRKLLFY